jgi:DNA-binding MarR family transcriptional regulator
MSRTPDEPALFGSLFVLAQQLTRRADGALAPYGLTSRQWLLLAVLSRAAGSPTLTDAARAYGSSRQNVKQVALQLAARGYLELRPDPADRRATRLVLTDRVAVFDEPDVAAAQSAFITEIFAPLTDDEVATLRSLVVRCITYLTDDEESR